jgi:hypothetical protein
LFCQTINERKIDSHPHDISGLWINCPSSRLKNFTDEKNFASGSSFTPRDTFFAQAHWQNREWVMFPLEAIKCKSKSFLAYDSTITESLARLWHHIDLSQAVGYFLSHIVHSGGNRVPSISSRSERERTSWVK